MVAAAGKQLKFRVRDAVIDLTAAGQLQIARGALDVLWALWSWADAEGGHAYPGNAALAIQTGKHPDSVSRALSELRKLGIVETTKHSTGKRRLANEHRLTEPSSWRVRGLHHYPLPAWTVVTNFKESALIQRTPEHPIQTAIADATTIEELTTLAHERGVRILRNAQLWNTYRARLAELRMAGVEIQPEPAAKGAPMVEGAAPQLGPGGKVRPVVAAIGRGLLHREESWTPEDQEPIENANERADAEEPYRPSWRREP